MLRCGCIPFLLRLVLLLLLLTALLLLLLRVTGALAHCDPDALPGTSL